MIASASAAGSSGGTSRRSRYAVRSPGSPARRLRRSVARTPQLRADSSAILPAATEAPRYAPLPHALDILDMTQNFEAGLCLPAFDFPLRDRGGIGRIAVACDHQPHLVAVAAHEIMRGYQWTHAFVIEQVDRQRQSSPGPRARATASSVRCRCPIPGSDENPAAIDADPASAARSSGFCTSTAERCGRLSRTRNSPATPAAKPVAFGLLEVNTKPSPASAFSRITGSPSAASDPITAGCNAT